MLKDDLKNELKQLKWFVVDYEDSTFRVVFDELHRIILDYTEYGSEFGLEYATRNFITKYAFKTKEEAVKCAREKIEEKYKRDLENILTSEMP